MKSLTNNEIVSVVGGRVEIYECWCVKGHDDVYMSVVHFNEDVDLDMDHGVLLYSRCNDRCEKHGMFFGTIKDLRASWDDGVKI